MNLRNNKMKSGAENSTPDYEDKILDEPFEGGKIKSSNKENHQNNKNESFNEIDTQDDYENEDTIDDDSPSYTKKGVNSNKKFNSNEDIIDDSFIQEQKNIMEIPDFALRVGSIIADKYLIKEYLSSGGYGITYKGRRIFEIGKLTIEYENGKPKKSKFTKHNSYKDIIIDINLDDRKYSLKNASGITLSNNFIELNNSPIIKNGLLIQEIKTIGIEDFDEIHKYFSNDENINVVIKEFFRKGWGNRIKNTQLIEIKTEFEKKWNDEKMVSQEVQNIIKKFNNVPRFIDFKEYNNTTYLIMEFIEGNNLGSFINKNYGSINYFNDLKVLFENLSNRVADFHSVNFIHRDIKPVNIMIGSNLNIKIVDLATMMEIKGKKGTKTDSKLRTKGYASPEQSQMGEKYLSKFSDVFSLGSTFYECLTGKKIYNGKNKNILLLIENEKKSFSTIIKDKSFNATINKELDELCKTKGLSNDKDFKKMVYVTKKSLNLNPKKRFKNANSIFEYLQTGRDKEVIQKLSIYSSVAIISVLITLISILTLIKVKPEELHENNYFAKQNGNVWFWYDSLENNLGRLYYFEKIDNQYSIILDSLNNYRLFDKYSGEKGKGTINYFKKISSNNNEYYIYEMNSKWYIQTKDNFYKPETSNNNNSILIDSINRIFGFIINNESYILDVQNDKFEKVQKINTLPDNFIIIEKMIDKKNIQLYLFYKGKLRIYDKIMNFDISKWDNYKVIMIKFRNDSSAVFKYDDTSGFKAILRGKVITFEQKIISVTNLDNSKIDYNYDGEIKNEVSKRILNVPPERISVNGISYKRASPHWAKKRGLQYQIYYDLNNNKVKYFENGNVEKIVY